MFLTLVGNQSFHVVVVQRLSRQLQVTVSQRLEDRQAFLPAPAQEEPVLGLGELQHPGVALCRALLAVQRVAFFGQQIETLRLDFCNSVGSRPGYVRQRPVRSASRPDASALESRRYLDNVSVSYAQLYLARVSDHFHNISIAAFIHSLGHQRLKSRPDLARREVAGGGDELDPQRHASLAAVAELEDGAARQRAVIYEVEYSHLIQIEDDLKLGGRDDLQSFEAVIHLAEGADEARLLHLHLLQHIRHHLAHLADGLGDGRLPRLTFLVVVFVEVIHQLCLGGYHIRAEIRVIHRSLAVSRGIQRGCLYGSQF